jgi:hypothetical protein
MPFPSGEGKQVNIDNHRTIMGGVRCAKEFFPY